MTRSRFSYLMILEVILCFVLLGAQFFFPDTFSSMLAFPFEQIGAVLRAMSLSGSTGNIMAIILFLLVVSLPFVAFVRTTNKRDLFAGDYILLFLGFFTCFLLYCMINPGLFPELFSAGIRAGKTLLGACFYSTLFGYWILRFLRHAFLAEKKDIYHYLVRLLQCLILIFLFVIFGQKSNELISSYIDVFAKAEEAVGNLTFTSVFLLFGYLVASAPYAMTILISWHSIDLLGMLTQNPNGEITKQKTDHLVYICSFSLLITVISIILYNCLQLLFTPALIVINSSLEFPLLPIAFVLVILLLIQYIRENQHLKEDNDLFI